MSQAAIRSNRGDDFQREIVLHWVIRLLSESEIASVEAETIADPDTNKPILVDDVIIRYTSGNIIYTQCKIASTNRDGWRLSDKVLREELVKARDQLEQDVSTFVFLYSQTPFGELAKLLDAAKVFHSADAVLSHADGNIQALHLEMSDIFQRNSSDSFILYKRLKVFSNQLDEYARLNNVELGIHLPNPPAARDVILNLIAEHAAQRTGSPLKITKDVLVNRLTERKIFLSTPYKEQLLVNEFAAASKIGRHDLSCQIAGEKLPRPELTQLVERCTHNGTTIVKGAPGSGKSWLLLELADLVEQNPVVSLLFVKGDRFSSIRNEDELSHALHLSGALSGMVERLAEKRRVVLVVDSLDTLSLSGNHLAVQTYLSILDRLDGRPNISIVCSCRTFDLSYDPSLRERLWGAEITVSELDPESVICPFLAKVGIDVDNVALETIRLLGNPQYLKLYETIHKDVPLREIRSVQALQELFLREKVLKNPLLSEPALSTLYDLTEVLSEQRALRCDRMAVSSSETMMRQLQSAGVLSGDESTVGFAHQTLFDALWVQKARKNGAGLLALVMGRPALPFYRPAIRAYVLYLHEVDSSMFVKEMRQLLACTDVPYHVRKLVLDTLAGIAPHENDVLLLRWLMIEDPDLFRRFLWNVQDEHWFRLFWNKRIVEEALFGDSSIEVKRQWVAWVGRKENRNNYEKKSVWRRFLKTDDENIRQQIMMDTDDVIDWLPEDRDIIETLVSWDTKGRIEHLMAAKIIRHFIEATSEGDDLLWGYIRHQIVSTEGFPQPFRLRPSLDVYDYEKKNFLANRLLRSESLLWQALEDLLAWVPLARQAHPDWAPVYTTLYIHSTSWERLHNDCDLRPHDGFIQLIDGIEQALKIHAVGQTALWEEFAPKLLASSESGLMFLAIRGCQAAPEQNVDFVESLFSEHRGLLYDNYLTHEFWELIHDTSPFLSEKTLGNIQQAGLETIEKAEADEKHWNIRHMYNLLSRVPRCYLKPETLLFMEVSSMKFGLPSHNPDIYGSGGFVPPPVSQEHFVGLSIGSQLRLLKFIDRDWSSEKHFSSDYRGMANVLSDAASFDPQKYLLLRELFANETIEQEYDAAIIEGCAKYLRYTSGNLKTPDGWQALSEQDPLQLARLILEYCEGLSKITTNAIRGLEACCAVLTAPADVARLISFISRMLSEELPEHCGDDIGSQALNTVHGEAVSAACRLYMNLSENGDFIPEGLIDIFRQAAANDYRPARWSLLRWLPYMLRHDEDVCWRLFQVCHKDNPENLWDWSAKFIYYTYWKHPERYLSYLERMACHQDIEVRKQYGILLSLYYLSEKIDRNDFWQKIETADEAIISGMAKVFSGNVEKDDCRRSCLEGLQWLLDKENLPKQVYEKIDNIFSNVNLRLPTHIPLKFIAHLEDSASHLHWFSDWLGAQSMHNPEEILMIMEALIQRVAVLERKHLWHVDGVVTASINILRHADLLGDEAIISRAIAIQDGLIRFHVDKMEAALEEAARI
jgi:hypothetical protein